MNLNVCLKKYETIFKNIIALFSIRGLEHILALVTLPYLVRVLGPEKYGSVAFAQGFVQYFCLVIDYGFNLTAIKNIAVSKNDVERGAIFSSIISSKFIIFLAVTIIFIFCIFIFEYFSQKIELFLCAYLMTIGNVILPVWFFQGIQKMHYIALMNLFARIAFVIGIFLIIKTDEDYVFLALLQSLTNCLIGGGALLILRLKYRYVYVMPHINDIKKNFKDGWHVFVSSIATNLYTVSNTILLGIITNDVIVGYFTGANKIISIFTSLLSPVSQAIYPYINKLLNFSKEDTIRFLRNILCFFATVYFIVFLMLYFFSEEIVLLLLGEAYRKSITLIQIMSILPFVVSISNVFIVQAMLPFGMQNLSSRIFIIAATINLFLALPMIYFFHDIGAAFLVTIIEIFIMCASGYIMTIKKVDVLGIGLLKSIVYKKEIR